MTGREGRSEGRSDGTGREGGVTEQEGRSVSSVGAWREFLRGVEFFGDVEFRIRY